MNDHISFIMMYTIIKLKNLPVTLLFIDFDKAFANHDYIHREKIRMILTTYGIPIGMTVYCQ